MTGAPWSRFEPANVAFCEPRLDAWIVEPGNAWSSLAYIAVAAWLFVRVVREHRHVLLLVASTSLAVGITSFAFHATGTFAGQFFDEASMFFISSLMVTLAIRRLRDWRTMQCAVCYSTMVVVLTALLTVVKTSGIIAFTVQITVAILLEVYLALRYRGTARHGAMWTALALYLLASVLWLGDLMRILCDPKIAHVVSGHIAWHILTAACLAVYYRYQEQFIQQLTGPRGVGSPCAVD